MILYKYLYPDRLDVLKNLAIRFTQPIDFNDPFELNLAIENGFKEEEYFKLSTLMFEQLKSQDNEQDPLFSNLTIEDLQREFRPYWKTVVKEMFLDFHNDNIGILSLTEIPNNILMWAHYAKSHMGFVIGFDTNHVFFKKINDKMNLKKVKYSKYRPQHETWTDFRTEEIYYTKSIDWSYEKEWRILKNIKNPDHEIFKLHTPICLYKFPASCIKTIIIGFNMRQSHYRELANILSDNSFDHVKIYKTKINDKEYKIDLIESDDIREYNNK